MALSQAAGREIACPVVLGTGLTGIAISRALSAAGIAHVLIGARPRDAPRLGESLNSEGSVEIARQFPEQRRFFFDKRQTALFFDGHWISADSPRLASGPAWYPLLGYPAIAPLLHVDRIGFDRAAFDSATGDSHCRYVEDPAASLDYDPAADRIDAVILAGGARVSCTYVFDATNHSCFVARKIGLWRDPIGELRRVTFGHWRGGEDRKDAPPWMRTTALLRLDTRLDPIDGLAWCIPLGDYVSVGISVDPDTVGANPALLLDWVETAYARRGIDIGRRFPDRSAPVDLRYAHYTHERCFGRNWLLAGSSYCQIWFPAAAGVATGLIAARLAPAIVRAPAPVAALYQSYMDEVAAGHAMLDWAVREAPETVALDQLRRRSQAMAAGNARRLGRYLALQEAPAELAFGDALARLYRADRLLANPLRAGAAPPEAQAVHLFASNAEPDPWRDDPIEVPVLTPPDRLEGPRAILGVVDILSGQVSPDRSAQWLAEDVQLRIDQFRVQGVSPWNAWVRLLRNSPRIGQLRLVAASLAGSGGEWVLTGQWQAAKDGRQAASPPLSLGFTIADERVAAIRTRRADYAFVTGDAILPPVAFAALLARLTETGGAAPHQPH